MLNLMKVLVVLAALAFVIALIGSLTGFFFLNVSPEGYSRACTNLALIAIALKFAFIADKKPV